ncbi:hypothetical protein D3C85_566340 [compost metagenome]
MYISELQEGMLVEFRLTDPNNTWLSGGPRRRRLQVDLDGWATGEVVTVGFNWAGINSTATDQESAYVHVDEEAGGYYYAEFREVSCSQS